MAPRVRFVLSSKGAQQLLNASKTRAMLRDRAERALDAAKASAPYDDSPDRDPDKPHYRDHLKVVDATTDRAVERVVADVPHSVGVEATFGTLVRALRHSR